MWRGGDRQAKESLGIIAALLELIAISWFKVKDTYTYPHLRSLENGTDDETEKLL